MVSRPRTVSRPPPDMQIEIEWLKAQLKDAHELNELKDREKQETLVSLHT